MKGSYNLKIPALLSIVLLILAGINVSAQQPASNINSLDDLRLLEEQGLELSQPAETGNPDSKPPVTLTDGDVLLIPESTADKVGMYDPDDGTYLGDLIDGTGYFSTPICAILGPDGNIYVSDQVADAVFVFDTDGTYLSTYADATDGLNNIRGIDFRNDTLFVTSGDDYVAYFDGPHSRISPDFINDGSDTFDILFIEGDSALVSDIAGTTDNVRLYEPDGTFNRQIISASFPEQTQIDIQTSGYFLTAFFSDGTVKNYDRYGTVYHSITFSSGRGVYRLGNGNILVTSGAGVFEYDDAGNLITTIRSGISARFIEYIPPLSPPEYGAIEGTVTESGSGTPLVGVDVIAEGTAIGDFTDANGDYILTNLLPGTYNISFSLAGYNDTTVVDVPVTANDTTDLDVEMTVYTPTYGSIAGVVTDILTADSVENVHVTVEGSSVEDYTDVNGEYNLDSLLTGDYNITFSHPSYVDSTVGPVTVTENDTAIVDISLWPLVGIIDGTVTDAITADSIEGVLVVAEGTTVQDYTDVDGYYFLGWLPIGDYNVAFSHADYNDSTIGPVTVMAFETTTLDAALISAPSGYEYVAGDANMIVGSWPPLVIGGDVTFLVSYFRGIVDPCLLGGFFCSGDANGDCNIIGSDVTRMVTYFRGLGDIVPCPDYESAWPTPEDIPDDAPSGWPNCETPPVAGD